MTEVETKKCIDCGKKKPLSEYYSMAGGTGSRPCKGCVKNQQAKRGAINQRAAIRLGLGTGHDRARSKIKTFEHLDRDTRTAEIAKQGEIDKETLASGEVKACSKCYRHYPTDSHGCPCRNHGETKKPHNDKNNPKRMYVDGEYISADHPLYTPGSFDSWDDVPCGPHRYVDVDSIPEDDAPPKPSKPRKVREARQVTKEVTYWEETGTSQDLHFNLQLKWGGCEFTGIEPASCNESHIVSRERCRRWDHPEWVWDEENAIYIFDALNNAMTRQGFWLHPGGLYLPAPGKDYPKWMVLLGIPGKRIVMTEKRRFFASQAAPIIL